jgi:hypothetical protein
MVLRLCLYAQAITLAIRRGGKPAATLLCSLALSPLPSIPVGSALDNAMLVPHEPIAGIRHERICIGKDIVMLLLFLDEPLE